MGLDAAGLLWRHVDIAVGPLRGHPSGHASDQGKTTGEIGPWADGSDAGPVQPQAENRGRTDGIGFMTAEPKSMGERLFARYPHGPMVQIPREDETRHHLFMGTTASGKTTAIKQVMIQARDFGQTRHHP